MTRGPGVNGRLPIQHSCARLTAFLLCLCRSQRFTAASDPRPPSRSRPELPGVGTVDRAKASVAKRLLELGDRDRARQVRTWYEPPSTSYTSAERHTFASYLGACGKERLISFYETTVE